MHGFFATRPGDVAIVQAVAGAWLLMTRRRVLVIRLSLAAVSFQS
jgi:hypothetical protein